MTRIVLFLLALIAICRPAGAHFVFVVPDPAGGKASVVFSETLKPDADVEIDRIATLKLRQRTAAGKDSALSIAKAKDAFTADPDASARLIFGSIDYGVTRRGDAEPFLLTYHPKAVIGDPFDVALGTGQMELVAVGGPGKLRFKLLADGKPVDKGEVNVILPDGGQKKSTIGPDGVTADSFAEPGRYGTWARHFRTADGESDGKKYQQIRSYATLVIDVARPATAAQPATRPAGAQADIQRLTPLPSPVSSFGAVACDGWLYVYGGHIARTHNYSTASVTGDFHRLKLDGGTAWEKLPPGPDVQGMNLATHGGKVYRVGGMQPRNAPGEKSDNHSIADAAVYDPAAGKWTDLPPLPQPRSSHDVAVVGDTLVVTGGWTMKGRGQEIDWCDTTLLLDLKSPNPTWQPIKQPWERRALIAAAYQGKLWVLGGFTEESDPKRVVDVYDLKTQTWSKGPEFPAPDRNGFSPAACVLDGKLYLSVADGSLFRLDENDTKWAKIATTTPRIVHRAVPDRGRVVILGGAEKATMLDLIEAVKP